MARVLIVGCGDVGGTLGLLLAAQHHEVWGLRRHAEAIPSSLHPLQADVTRPETMDILPKTMDYVVYAAAAQGFSDAAYRAAYVDGVRNVLKALSSARQSLKRFIFTSSTGVYGQRDGAWVDERSETSPNGFSGWRMLEAERLVLSGNVAGTVVRFGGIYGPGRHRLIDRVRSGAPCVMEPPLFTNRIHRDDCAGVLRHLLLLEHPDSIYVAVDDEPAEECAVMDWIAQRLGLPLPQRKRATGLVESPRPANKRCSNARLKATGYRFQYPTFREGYAAVLEGGGP